MATTSSGSVCDGRQVGGDAPPVEYKDAVSQMKDLVDVVGHQQDRGPLGVQFHDELFDLARSFTPSDAVGSSRTNKRGRAWMARTTATN